MINGNTNFGFSYIWNMANFEAFHWNFSPSINLLFLKSDFTCFQSILILWYKNIGQVGAWTALPSSYAVEVMDENDIVNAVKFAKQFNLRLVVKGTGKL